MSGFHPYLLAFTFSFAGLGFTLFILPCYRMTVTRLTTAVTASGILSITFPS